MNPLSADELPQATHIIMTAAPRSETAALNELRRSARDTAVVRRLEPGTLLVALDNPLATLLPAWQAHPPVWTRHVHPVHATAALSEGDAGLERLAAAATPVAVLLAADLPFSVQTRLVDEGPWPLTRFDINQRLSGLLADLSGAALDVREPQQVLSVTATTERAYLGVSPIGLNLSTWNGGMMRFGREPDQVSRSEFKLLESLAVFNLTLPSRGTALDLGAAPGGWTRVLRTRGLDVMAVDPATLDGRLAGIPGIEYVQSTVQRYRAGGRRFDVLANDMRMDALDSVEVMLEVREWLRPGGLALMTLKLPEEQFESVVAQALQRLRAGYEILGARQLFHNRHEVTVALQRRLEP